MELHPHHWPSRGTTPDAIHVLHTSRRTRHAMRHDPNGPTPVEREAARTDRSRLALEIGALACILLLAFMILPALAAAIGRAL